MIWSIRNLKICTVGPIDVMGIAEFISNPAAYEAFKALLTDPDVLAVMTGAVVQGYE